MLRYRMCEKYRAVPFTINNPTDEDTNQVLAMKDHVVYIVVGKEKGEQGTPHYQGYMYFKNPRNLKALKKMLPRAHFSLPCKGTHGENQRYCKKEGDILIEEGTLPRQGERNDIEEVRDMLKDGYNMRKVVECSDSYQAIKVAEVYLKYHEKQRDWKPEVRWYYGSTGAGKTKQAREWLGEDIYTCLDGIKWFEGYDAHENVLIDDFRRDFAKFHQMLKLLDRYPYRVETKGGSRQFLAKKIAITAPYKPEEIYNIREDVQQLLRRIDQVILVGHPVGIQIEDEEDLID